MRRSQATFGQVTALRRAFLGCAMLAVAGAVALAAVQQAHRMAGVQPGLDAPIAAITTPLVGGVVASMSLISLAAVSATSGRPSTGRFRQLRTVPARWRAAANAGMWSSIAGFAVMATADAFAPLPGGAIMAGLVFGGAIGTVTATVHHRAHQQPTYRSFNMVAMVLAAGCLASMNLTTTGDWWRLNFSTLGTSNDLAAACFNAGLILSGSAIALMSGRLASGLARPEHAPRRGAVHTVRLLIAVIGLSLVAVGLVPIDSDEVVHNVFAATAGAAFAVLASGSPIAIRNLPRALMTTSRVSLVIEVAAFVLYDGLSLASLTVFEIVAFALVFVWLTSLVITTHPIPVDEASNLLAGRSSSTAISLQDGWRESTSVDAPIPRA